MNEERVSFNAVIEEHDAARREHQLEEEDSRGDDAAIAANGTLEALIVAWLFFVCSKCDLIYM